MVAQSAAILLKTLALLAEFGHVQLNLGGVSFVATGVAVLQSLVARGVEIINTTVLGQAPLEGDEIEGMDTEAICKILEVTRTNLGVLLHRVRNRLRECLRRKG